MTWLVDGQTFARKVKNPAGHLCRNGVDYRSKCIYCPSCGDVIDHSHTGQEWPGLPAGVKFDPSDQELVDHLAAKRGLNGVKSHPFIDEFIPTLDGEDGICYTHPENLPGIRCDGRSSHFFHRPTKAYTTGNRKRRRIQSEPDDTRFGGEMRWHKTGKTRPVVENGKQLGCKKIMVLYISMGKKAKPEKTNWVMHQYHLGVQEEEKEGELVVSKVFYQTQPRQSVAVHRGDGDCLEHAETEMTEEVAQCFPQSSASAFTTRLNSQGTPVTPRIPAPSRPQTGKHHRGLETISEEVNQVSTSLSTNALENMNWSPDQMADPGLLQVVVSEQGDQHDCSSLGWANGHLQENERSDYMLQSKSKSVQDHQVFQADHLCNGRTLEGESQHILEDLDIDLMGLLCDESLQADSNFKIASKHDSLESFRSIAADYGLTLDNVPDEPEESKADSVLENIILDTPPDFLLEPLLNSQDTLEWLGKRKFGSNSQRSSGAEDLNAIESRYDSQSNSQLLYTFSVTGPISDLVQTL